MATAYSNELTVLDTHGAIEEKGLLSGPVKSAIAEFAAGTGDIDNDDVIMMVELPSSSKLLSCKVFNDDLDSDGSPALAANLGVYVGKQKIVAARGNGTAYDADSVLSEDCIASAITTFQAANTTGVELRFEEANITTADDELWELAGLSEDPGVPLRLAFTVSTAATAAAAGDIVLHVLYTV